MIRMLTIRRPVRVKVIVTEASRQKLLDDYQRQLKQILTELKQWQFQGKKLLADAQKRSADAYKLAQERVAREERVRKEKAEILQFQIRQVENLPEGSELDYGTVESVVEVKVGDAWDEIMAGTEIVLKDGLIHEIRQGGNLR
jgi:hypothetical protein